MTNAGTPFSVVYDSFLSKITDDMYMELTEQETFSMLKELLTAALPLFEFPRISLAYEKETVIDEEGNDSDVWSFSDTLNLEEIDIIATYMIVQWLGQQLASVENVRMKYSGADFKFTSQANHMQKLLQLKTDYNREGFHLQRLYKRRKKDTNGVYHSTFGQIVEIPSDWEEGAQ